MTDRRRTRRPSLAERIEARPARYGTVVLVVVLAITAITTVTVDGLPFGGGKRTVRVQLPGGAPLLRPGGEVRIAGRRVGSVKAVRPTARGALATVETSEEVGAGATARVRLRGLAGAVYLELAPGDTAKPLPAGATIARDRVTASPDIATVVAGFDADARTALARTATTAGQGLAGRGRALNGALRAAPDALEGAAPLVRAVRPAPGALAGLLDAADTVSRSVAPTGTGVDLGTLAEAANGVAAPVADRADDLRRTIERVPGAEFQALRTLPELDAVLGDAEPALDRLAPAADRLADVLPAVHGLERDAHRGRFRDATALAVRAKPVLDGARPVVGEAHWPARTLQPIADPTGALARYLVPYRQELVEAPAGFTRWGSFAYDAGQGKGHRAVRFTMVLSCITGRNPYPKPGEAAQDRRSCR